MKPSRRVVLLTLVALLCGALLVAVALVGIAGPRSSIKTLSSQVLVANSALSDASVKNEAAQRDFLAALTSTPEQRSALITESQRFSTQADTAWREYKRAASPSAAEQALQKRYDELTKASTRAGATTLGLADSPDRAAYQSASAQEVDTSRQQIAVLIEARGRFYAPRIQAQVSHAGTSLDAAQTWILVVFGVVVLLGLLTAAFQLRGALLGEARAAVLETERRVDERRADLENQLQRGLEMEPTEEATYGVIAAALRHVRPDAPVELLTADSSRAHFRQVLSTDATGKGPGCPVTSPAECPTTNTGQVHVFRSSTRLDACPFLREREGPARSAACVPVSIAGTTTGVIHTTGPADEAPPAEQIDELELVARKAGDRIGYLRVLSRTEVQARIDMLTGLFNRRSLEAEALEVLARADPFCVAFADLDHFKLLNDAHGHETGDRALRLFGRVLRDTVRPADIPSRFGGEEFVALLPDCALADARVVADRIRHNLSVAVAASTVPEFTVSIGIAAWEPNETFADTVARADAALLEAKGSGRDRVISAAPVPVPVPGPITGTESKAGLSA